MMGAYVESQDRFIIFGGSAGGLMNDVWELRPSISSGPIDQPFTIPPGGAIQWTTGMQTGAATLGYARVRRESSLLELSQLSSRARTERLYLKPLSPHLHRL
jgi:hypothetical protein